MPAPVNAKVRSFLIGASVDLSRYEESVKADIRKMLAKLRTQLVGEIAERGSTGTAFAQHRAEQLLKATDSAINATYKDVAVDMSAKMTALGRIQNKVAAQAINTQVGAVLVDTVFNATQLKTLASSVLIEGAPSAEWWARAAKSTREKFTDNIRQGMLKGETVQQLVQRVQAPGSGLMSKATHQAEALVRTSVQTVANTVRQEVYKENEDLFNGIQWISTLDDRTSEICQSLDGLTWDNDLEPIGHDQVFPGATAHWGCRSTQIPLLKKWEELIGDSKFAQELDKAEAENPGTRASMDGQVPAKQTYEDWLKDQSVEKQIEILGPGKWEMWQEGKLYWSEMVDPTGRPLTLKELEAQYSHTGSSVGAASVADLEQMAAAELTSKDAVGAVDALAKQIKDNPASAALEAIAAGKAPQGIGQLAMSMLYEGKTDAQVLAAIAEKYPASKTSPASMAWYKSKVKALQKLKVAENELNLSLKAAQEAIAAVQKLDAVIPTSLVEQAAAVAAEQPLKKGGMGIGNLTIKLIKEGKTNQEILAEIKAIFPNAKSSNATINWYKNKLKSLTAQELSGGGIPKGIHSKAKVVHTKSLEELAAAAAEPKFTKAQIQKQMTALHKNMAIAINGPVDTNIKQVIEAWSEKHWGASLPAHYLPKNTTMSDFWAKVKTLTDQHPDWDTGKLWSNALKNLMIEKYEQQTGINLATGAVKKAVAQAPLPPPVLNAGVVTGNVGSSGIPTALYEEAKAYSKKAWGYEVQIPANFKYDPAEAKKIAAKFHITNDPAGELAKALNQAYLKENQSAMQAKLAAEQAAKQAKEKAFLESLEGPTPTPPGFGAGYKEAGSGVEAELQRLFSRVFEGQTVEGFKAYAASEISALKSYTGSAYSQWNSALRALAKNPNHKLDPATYKKLKNMAEALERNGLDRDLLLFRGIGSGAEVVNEMWAAAQQGGLKSLVGRSITDAAFQSTSTSSSFSKSWGGGKGLFLEILAPKGTPGAYVQAISYHKGEKEWLLPPGMTFVIEKAEYITQPYGGSGVKLKLTVRIERIRKSVIH